MLVEVNTSLLWLAEKILIDDPEAMTEVLESRDAVHTETVECALRRWSEQQYEDESMDLAELTERFRLLSQRGNFSLSLRQRLWKRDAGLCGICGEPAEEATFHIDHIRPVAADGSNNEANLQVSHPECNMRKQHRWLPEDEQAALPLPRR
jgi:hypothetical protein